jgi:predicted dehydrogenase
VSARILLVGYGRRGRQWADASARHHRELAGVVDPDVRARTAAEAAGLATWPSLDAALPSARADAAIVASPPALHVPHALACLDAGLGVLIEKPLALSLSDAMAVADAADAAERAAVVGHNFRHRALERALRRALDAGAIGELRTAAISTARPSAGAASEGASHAPLWDLGVHHLDLLRLRMGGAPDVVDATVTSSAGGVTYRVHLEWDGRAAADYWLREGASVYHHAEWLEGSRGALRAVDGRAWLVTPDRRPRRLRPPAAPDGKRVLLDALAGRGSSAVSAREALGTVATLEAAARSVELGRSVRLAELERVVEGAAT